MLATHHTPFPHCTLHPHPPPLPPLLSHPSTTAAGHHIQHHPPPLSVANHRPPAMTGLGATDIPIDTITEVMDAGGWYKVGRWSIPEALLRTTDWSLCNSDNANVDMLETGMHHIVVTKPPVVVVHNSGWTMPSNTVGAGGTDGGYAHAPTRT